MKIVGNPQDKIQVIHIAGTSGKTSTAYYLSSLLIKSTKSVGQLISPHVDIVTERIQINGKKLSPKEFYTLLVKFLEIIETNQASASYFEILYAFAFWVFVYKNVDYAVVETGIGGKYDATNITRRPDKVCVITAIGYDHMNILGHDIKQIAAHKAGIIYKYNQVIMLKQAQDIKTVIKQRVIECSANLIIVDDNYSETSLLIKLPKYQRQNWLIAKRTYDYLCQRDNLNQLNNAQISMAQRTYIPARMETIQIANKIIIMDGAHNSPKIKALASSISELYPNQKITVVLALKKDKDIEDMSQILNTIASSVIATMFKTTVSLPYRSVDATLLANELIRQGLKNVKSVNEADDALKLAIGGTNKIIVVTGSFYLLGQLRASGALPIHSYN